ncbi:serine hydrolase domain-containing protein [Pseudoxanthomonas sp. UTMC 1351]|uniref:serine hydrolase domain-containing protein n=1 Tax=Pseudoxanthomonas sp. UTMC 1351 TaxID=2695853 RepID=UPI0034CD576C
MNATTIHNMKTAKHRPLCAELLGSALGFALLTFAGTAAAATALEDASTRTALATGLRPTVLHAGEALPHWSLQERMAHHHVPGVAIAVLRDGQVVHSVGYGTREAGTHDPVDGDTLFSVGSVSKIVTAATTLRLVADGKLALDRDVNTYLKSWQIIASPKAPHPMVTLRMLMSHTAGLGVHGFADYLPGEAMPTLLQILDGKAPAKNDPVRLVHPPGERGDYSGGGVMVEQLVLEETTGLPLESIARMQVFDPLRMRRSTFANPLPASAGNIAKAHDGNGAVTALPRGWQSFPEQAASGLWSSANDLGAFVAGVIGSYRGNGNFLPRPIATQMMTEVSPSWHGLGPRLDGAGTTRIFHHGGSNDSYRAWIEGYLETGDGFVILTNGENGGALSTEIRNALSDAVGRGVNPPVRAIALDLQEPAYADYAGTFVIDSAVPMDHRRALADFFDIEALEVKVADGEVRVGVAGRNRTSQMLPLTPNRFVSPDIDSLELEFHRNAQGRVNALSIEHGAARAHYTRRE